MQKPGLAPVHLAKSYYSVKPNLHHYLWGHVWPEPLLFFCPHSPCPVLFICLFVCFNHSALAALVFPWVHLIWICPGCFMPIFLPAQNILPPDFHLSHFLHLSLSFFFKSVLKYHLTKSLLWPPYIKELGVSLSASFFILIITIPYILGIPLNVLYLLFHNPQDTTER